MIEVNYSNGQLDVSFANEEGTVNIDSAIYPKSEEIKAILERIDLSQESKRIQNLLKVKEMVWRLYEILKAELNRMPNRNPDYKVLEDEYKMLMKVNELLFLGIQFIHKNVYTMVGKVENPVVRYN